MTVYVYKAKKSNAETVTGQVSAHSEEEAVDLISQLGLLPVVVEPRNADDISRLNRPQPIRIKDLYLFTRQVTNLLRAGVSILKALDLVAEQIRQIYFRQVIERIAWNVRHGKSFSESLEEFPAIFPDLYVTMVRAGEESSQLHEMLSSVAEHLKRQDALMSRARSAMVYPLIMAFVGAATVVFIMTFVLPKMEGLFLGLGGHLPVLTKILLAASKALKIYGLWILIGVLAVTGVTQRWVQSPAGKKTLSKAVLRIPYIGRLILKVELARFSRTLLLLMKNGIPIIRSLAIAIPILGNDVIKRQLLLCREYLVAGGSLGEGLQKAGAIPALMAHLIAIGEESGNLEEVLLEIAQMYEQDAEEQLKVLTTMVEPLMILAVGLVIGLIVFAMLLPVFQVDVLIG